MSLETFHFKPGYYQHFRRNYIYYDDSYEKISKIFMTFVKKIWNKQVESRKSHLDFVLYLGVFYILKAVIVKELLFLFVEE